MKKGLFLITIMVALVIFSSGCGGKGEEDVVGDLTQQLDGLTSYKMKAQLTLQTAEEPHEYDVEVWYKKPNYYRIGLINQKRETSQIILRNDDGVFVLTPHLNKSFRFQSGWPENHGQVYLYESLVKDVISDTNRNFSIDNDQYVFEVAANYQSKTLTHQKIYFNKDLTLSKVEVMDADYNVLVNVSFSETEFNYSFEDDAFDMKRNMESALLKSIPTMANQQEEETGSFGTYYPSYTPANVENIEEEVIESAEGDPRVVLRYAGDYHYNIVQERPQAKMVHMPSGEPVNLGYTYGVMGNGTLSWTYNGVDFLLSSSDLPKEEMIKVAQSVMGQAGK